MRHKSYLRQRGVNAVQGLLFNLDIIPVTPKIPAVRKPKSKRPRDTSGLLWPAEYLTTKKVYSYEFIPKFKDGNRKAREADYLAGRAQISKVAIKTAENSADHETRDYLITFLMDAEERAVCLHKNSVTVYVREFASMSDGKTRTKQFSSRREARMFAGRLIKTFMSEQIGVNLRDKKHQEPAARKPTVLAKFKLSGRYPAEELESKVVQWRPLIMERASKFSRDMGLDEAELVSDFEWIVRKSYDQFGESVGVGVLKKSMLNTALKMRTHYATQKRLPEQGITSLDRELGEEGNTLYSAVAESDGRDDILEIDKNAEIAEHQGREHNCLPLPADPKMLPTAIAEAIAGVDKTLLILNTDAVAAFNQGFFGNRNAAVN